MIILIIGLLAGGFIGYAYKDEITKAIESIKEYWTKFYADAFEDAKSFWKNYADTVEKLYKK